MITTIQIHDKVKKDLDKLKENQESYEEVILKLMEKVEKEKRKNKELLKEGCIAMAEENLKITREFEAIDEDLWEW